MQHQRENAVFKLQEPSYRHSGEKPGHWGCKKGICFSLLLLLGSNVCTLTCFLSYFSWRLTMVMNLPVTSFTKRSIPNSTRTSKLLPSPRDQPEREAVAESHGHQETVQMTIKFQWYIPNPVLISNSQFTLSHIDHSPVDWSMHKKQH